jgi:hypothetical protein
MKKPALKRKVTTYTVVTWELDWEGDEPAPDQPAPAARPETPAADELPPEAAEPAGSAPDAEQPHPAE